MKPHLDIFGLSVASYGIWVLAGALCAFLVLWRLMRARGMRAECAVVMTSCAFGFALLGGYALYLLASVGVPALIAAARAGRLLQVLSGGGLVFYGGLLGGAFGAWLGARIVGLRFIAVVDLCAPPLALAHAFGRVGCLFAGCCYGMPCDLFFCFSLSPHIAGGARLFPVQAFEAACNLLLFVLLMRALKKSRPVGYAAGLYLMGYALCRFALEFFRYDAIRGRILSLSTSQFLSIPAFLIGALLFFCVSRLPVDPNPFASDIGKISDR